MIIDRLKEFFCQYPDFSEPRVDFLGEDNYSFSINPVPCESVIKTYRDGGSMKQYCFILAVRLGYGKTPAQENIGILERFAEWIEKKSRLGELPVLGEGKTAQRLEVTESGAMKNEDIHSAEYNIKCRLVYTESV